MFVLAIVDRDTGVSSEANNVQSNCFAIDEKQIELVVEYISSDVIRV